MKSIRKYQNKITGRPITTQRSLLLEIIRDRGATKAERELGYRAVPLGDMVSDTVDWMRERGLLQ